MTRRILSLLALGFILLLAGSCSKQIPVEEGVSHLLAENRKASIENLRYRLLFNIPAAQESAVTGAVEIIFEGKRNHGQFPQIDFKAPEGAIHSVTLNGESPSWHHECEHLIIDSPLKADTTYTVSVEFTAPNQSLNRRSDVLYTLLVPDRARTLFPCFDQPDLKAVFHLSLELPEEWVGVTNTAMQIERPLPSHRKRLTFGESEPLSTYLFSFVAGAFQTQTAEKDGQWIAIYYRENDPKKLAQIPDIFNEVFTSLEWLETYTNIPYPFAKYDFIVLPDFQYGGMEHTGATLYNDNRIFLNEGAGEKEKSDRFLLIAHETAHMWFGDLVTMKWFDEVWTKEVFANYFATKILKAYNPDTDLGMNFADYATSAYSEDRTEGSTPVIQPLDNLRYAGLVYSNIIYNKTPIIMEMMASRLGEEAFQAGIREYLKAFSYGNATWSDLIAILDRHTPDDLAAWSRAWVEERGMPHITLSQADGHLLITQKDPFHRGLVWPQSLTLRLCFTDGSSQIECISLNHAKETLGPWEGKTLYCVVPNIDAKSYGYFETGTPERLAEWLLSSSTGNRVEKASTLINLNESYLNDCYSPQTYSRFLLDYLQKEHDELLFAQALGSLSHLVLHHPEALPIQFETTLWEMVYDKTRSEICRRRTFSFLTSNHRTEESTARLMTIFHAPKQFKPFTLTEPMLTTLCYQLCISQPLQTEELIATGRKRCSNDDRRKTFDFISRAVSADEEALDSLFETLMEPENRRPEPSAQSVLAYLNHPLRAERSRKYIRPALEELIEIQATGDIFFPKGWVQNLLAGHPEAEADTIIADFFKAHPNYPSMLKAKILQTRYHPQ